MKLSIKATICHCHSKHPNNNSTNILFNTLLLHCEHSVSGGSVFVFNIMHSLPIGLISILNAFAQEHVQLYICLKWKMSTEHSLHTMETVKQHFIDISVNEVHIYRWVKNWVVFGRQTILIDYEKCIWTSYSNQRIEFLIRQNWFLLWPLMQPYFSSKRLFYNFPYFQLKSKTYCVQFFFSFIEATMYKLVVNIWWKVLVKFNTKNGEQFENLNENEPNDKKRANSTQKVNIPFTKSESSEECSYMDSCVWKVNTWSLIQ